MLLATKSWGALLLLLSLHVSLIKSDRINEITKPDVISDSGVRVKVRVVEPYVDLNGTTYYFESFERYNWFQAYEFCWRLGFRLVSIESAQENALIVRHLIDIGASFSYWTCGSDLAVLDTWTWHSSGSEISYYDWDEGQPNHGGNCDSEERAIYLWHESGFRWADTAPLTQYLHFICELETDRQ